MNSIPASQLVNVIPGVLGAGGNPLSLNSVFVTHNGAVPIGSVMSFATLADVQDFFGASAQESLMAAVYFAGFEGATRLPGTLYFVQDNASNVAAYLRSASLADMTLAELQGLSGTLIIDVDGETITTANIDLSGATSFSNAATIIQAALQASGTIFSGTGTIGDGSGGAGTILNVSAVASGKIHVGDIIRGGPTPTQVLSQQSGTPGGIGLYTVANSQDFEPGGALHIDGTATAAFDSQRHAFVISSPTTGDDSTIGFATGTLAAGLELQAAQGAVTSQGADAATAADVMNTVVANTQNWALFATTYEPDLAGKEAFAAWVQTTNERYTYVAWDSDVTALQPNASGTFGAIVNAANDFGVVPVYNDDGLLAALVCAIAASIDFTAPNGALTFAFKAQAGLVANVTDATEAQNLLGNGYNFYGSYATANQQFSFLQNGQISGDWNWIDAYVNQIYFNSQCQLALVELLAHTNSVPYNATGYALLRSALLDPIGEALNNGTIKAGVTLSNAQRAQINTAANGNVADTLQNQGWYLQILDADPSVRAVRGSPPMTLWYTDGGSIQSIELSSIDVQ